jgi:hypothetical protein
VGFGTVRVGTIVGCVAWVGTGVGEGILVGVAGMAVAVTAFAFVDLLAVVGLARTVGVFCESAIVVIAVGSVVEEGAFADG